MLEAYRRAIPELTVMEDVMSEKMKREQLLITARMLGYREETLRRLEEQLARGKPLEEAVEDLRKLRDPEVQTNGDGFQAKIIEEDELISYVEQGWEPFKELKMSCKAIKIS